MGANHLGRLDESACGGHLCFIYSTDEEHRSVLSSFLGRGLECGEKVIYVTENLSQETLLSELRENGLHAEHYLEDGQFKIVDANESFLQGNSFSPEKMIALLQRETEEAVRNGYSALRITSEMGWALKGVPGSERLIEFEWMLNRFFTGWRILSLCQYDRRRFSPAILLYILATHPVVVVGTDVYDNFYFGAGPGHLGEGSASETLEWWLESLSERHVAGKTMSMAQCFLGGQGKNIPTTFKNGGIS